MIDQTPNTTNSKLNVSLAHNSFYSTYAQPVWVQLSMLVPGDVFVVQTQSTIYCVFVVASGVGLVLTQDISGEESFGNLSGFLNPHEVLLYGAYDLESSTPLWGKVQVGLPFLFAPCAEPSSATRTSAVEKIYVKKMASRASVAVPTPRPAAAGLKPLAGGAKLPPSSLLAGSGVKKPLVSPLMPKNQLQPQPLLRTMPKPVVASPILGR